MAETTKHLLVAALLEAANNVDEAPSEEVQALLRRAAISLRSASLLPDELTLDDALSAAARDMLLPKQELVPIIVREWLRSHGYLSDHTFTMKASESVK